MSLILMRRVAHPSFLLLAVLMVTALSFVGCSKPPGIASLMISAKQERESGDLKAAVIQLKNVLQRKPHHAEARFMLGSIYLQLGQAGRAENNFREALRAKYDRNRVLPLMARALFEQGKFQELLDETRSSDHGAAAQQPEVLSMRGHAQLSLGDVDEASRSFEAALKAAPDFAPALLGQVRLAIRDHDGNAALEMVDRAVASDPASVDAWLMKGDLERSLNGLDAAKAAYRKALELAPGNVAANFNMASASLAAGHVDEAKTFVDSLLKSDPRNPLGHYLQGLLRFRQKDFEGAKAEVRQVLAKLPDYLPAKALSAAITHYLGSGEQAERQLEAVLKQYPRSVYLRKLLAETLLNERKVAKALKTLDPLIKATPSDAGVLALIGNAYYQLGDGAQAQHYFEEAARRRPDTPQLRAGLGMARLAAGDTARALADLEAAVASGYDEADMLLVTSLVAVKQYAKALATLRSMEKARPDDPEILNKKGVVLVGLKEYNKARRAFEAARRIQSGYFPASMNLAALDIHDNHPEAARARYEKILEATPSNIEVMSALAKLEAAAGNSDEAVHWLERARGIQPRAFAVNYALGELFFNRGEYFKATVVLKDALAVRPGHAEALNMLGYAQLQLGLASDAVSTYTKLTTLFPKSAQGLYGLSGAQAARGYRDSAILSLLQALELKPDFPEASNALANLYIEAGKTDEALKIAHQAQRRHPQSPLGFLIAGNIRMAQGKYAQATQAYRSAFELENAGSILIKLHTALARTKGNADADKLLANWVETHPDDALVRLYYADGALKKGDYALAIRQYQQVLEQQPDKLGILHNLGWAYRQQQDMKHALQLAEKAYKIKPDSPAVLADLAELLQETGENQRAVKLLERARDRLPSSTAVRFRLVQAYLRIDDKAHARSELKRLLATQDPFPHRKEAEGMFERLNR